LQILFIFGTEQSFDDFLNHRLNLSRIGSRVKDQEFRIQQQTLRDRTDRFMEFQMKFINKAGIP
jgi:hypothetical protein